MTRLTDVYYFLVSKIPKFQNFINRYCVFGAINILIHDARTEKQLIIEFSIRIIWKNTKKIVVLSRFFFQTKYFHNFSREIKL